MDSRRLQAFIETNWAEHVMPALTDYISIPCVSPGFDPDWAAHGHIAEAVSLLAAWARTNLSPLGGVSIEVHSYLGRTPLLLIDVAATAAYRGEDAPVIIYGHLDKQPAMDGWRDGRSAWTPTLEGDRLYGRGGADDGYALFSAVLALRALDDQQVDRPRCILLIEASEESSSEDLPFYFDKLASRLGTPSLVIALDSMCGNYDQLWTTTSLRGQVAGTLTVRVLADAMHSGEASGIVPSSFRIATHLLSRIEAPATGTVTAAPFVVDIQPARLAEAGIAAGILGHSTYDTMPFILDARPASEDIATLLTNRSWRPQLAVLAADGLPAISNAASVMLPATALQLSLRLPPTLEPTAAGHALKALLEADPPYGAKVTFDISFRSPGWHAPDTAAWLSRSLDAASLEVFGRGHAAYGGGGGIPFLNMLGQSFPEAQFVVTGVLGPQSNAHGPNEFLHLPTAKKITAALAHILRDAAHR